MNEDFIHREEPGMNTVLLQCQHVTKQFRVRQRGVDVLSNITLTVRSGETVLISGRSGQGKSVLLSLLGGLDSPSSGKILFDGISLSSYSPSGLSELRKNKIGIIFQHSNLISSWTALENVASALENNGDSYKEQVRSSAEILGTFGLGERLHHLPHELSMGEQQRVAIARALVRKPPLLLCDEPMGELDPMTADDIVKVFFQYLLEHRTAAVITSHGYFPHTHVHRSLILQKGRIIPRRKKFSHRPSSQSLEYLSSNIESDHGEIPTQIEG